MTYACTSYKKKPYGEKIEKTRKKKTRTDRERELTVREMPYIPVPGRGCC